MLFLIQSQKYSICQTFSPVHASNKSGQKKWTKFTEFKIIHQTFSPVCASSKSGHFFPPECTNEKVDMRGTALFVNLTGFLRLCAFSRHETSTVGPGQRFLTFWYRYHGPSTICIFSIGKATFVIFFFFKIIFQNIVFFFGFASTKSIKPKSLFFFHFLLIFYVGFGKNIICSKGISDFFFF